MKPLPPKKLTRLDKPVERTKLKRMDERIGQKPLTFLEGSPSCFSPTDPNATPEEQHEKIDGEILTGFAARAKAEAFRFAETTRTDYFFTMVFEHGDQAVAFLRSINYRESDSMYVDGMIVAKLLNIELPRTPFRLRPLRPADKSLNRLVTLIPSRTGIKATKS